MHYAPHALLHCVAWLSLLGCGNAARGASPASEVLTHFAHTVGTVLAPSLAGEAHAARQNRSAPSPKDQPIRRQTDENQAPAAEEPRGPGEVSPGPAAAAPGAGISPFPAQGIPFQYERTYHYRYPPFNEQLTQNFFPGNAAATGFGGNQLLNSGVPFDPRLFQAQLGAQQLQLAPADVGKPLEPNVNANANSAKQESGSNANSIQTLEAGSTGGDSKSSAQNRPFEGADFAALPQPGVGGGAGPGVGAGAGGGGNFGNVRVDNRFSTLGYERVRQNYYRDPPLDQRNYFSPSFNEIPFSGGAGYRSPIGERYSDLEFAGRPGIGPSSELRSSGSLGGLGDPYFGGFFQGLNYNSLPGGGVGGAVGAAEGAGPGFENYRFGPGGGNFQYPARGAGGAPYFQGSDGADFGEGDSSLRGSSAKERVAQTETRRQGEEINPGEGVQGGKVSFVEVADKTEKPSESGQA